MVSPDGARPPLEERRQRPSRASMRRILVARSKFVALALAASTHAEACHSCHVGVRGMVSAGSAAGPLRLSGGHELAGEVVAEAQIPALRSNPGCARRPARAPASARWPTLIQIAVAFEALDTDSVPGGWPWCARAGPWSRGSDAHTCSQSTPARRCRGARRHRSACRAVEFEKDGAGTPGAAGPRLPA
jgi:hypothetical protein